jgi:hypothetical protein
MPTAYLGGAHLRMFMNPTPVPGVGTSAPGGSLGSHLVLRIRRDQLTQVRELLTRVAAGPEGAFALLCDADPDANAHLAWLPGDTEPFSITPSTGDASCLTGGFLALVFGPTIAESGRVVEDGFALTLSADSWARVHSALVAGEPVTLPVKEPDQIGLSVEWTGAPPGAGETRTDAPPAAFRLDSVVLYQPDEVLQARGPSAGALAEFVKQVEAAAAEFWSGRPTGEPRPVLVVAAFRPGGRLRVWVEVPDALDLEPVARELAARLEQRSAPVVQHGPVAVAMRMSLWGGGGEWPFIPKEWLDAAEAAGRDMKIPDDILDRIWPG